MSIFRKTVVAGCALIGSVGLAWGDAGHNAVPKLGGDGMGWAINWWDYILDPPPGSGHGPIKTDPRYPYNSQIQNGGLFRGGEFTPAIADTRDPILKQWAATQMQQDNEELISGKRKLHFVAQSRCWPGGVPGQDLFIEPLYFVQTPKEVLMVWQRNNWVRHIYLQDKHSPNIRPSWFGESIGHYENGDTLVIDTVGIAGGPLHFIDNFHTPHTDKLHVVERFTVSPDSKKLTVVIKVEDPDTFNGPLTLTDNWRRNDVEIAESVCAEDGGVDRFNANLYPIPQATKSDF
jgi:hypothetical protein